MKTLRANIVVLTAFFILALVFTFPLILHFGDQALGGMDANFFIWQSWWFKKAIFELHQNPLGRMDYLFYPNGVSLANGYDGLISVAIQLLLTTFFSPVVSYNLFALISYTFSGFFAFLLIKRLISNRWASFLGGIIFGFSSYMLARGIAGHANLLSAWTIPLFILLYLRMEERGNPKSSVGAGLALTLVAFASWQYFFIILFFLFFRFVYQFFFEWDKKWLTIGNHLLNRSFAIFFLTAVLTTLPFTVPLIAGYLGHGTTRPNFSEYLLGSANLVSFVTPPPTANLGGDIGQFVYKRIPRFNDPEATYFLGFLEIIFLLIAIKKVVKDRDRTENNLIFWLLSGLFFLILSLGPVLFILDQPVVPLPYAVIPLLPFLNLIRVPARFSIILFLCSAIVSAAVIKRLSVGLSQVKQLGFFMAIFAILLTERLSLPFPLLQESHSYFYQKLSREKEAYAVLDLPLWDINHNALGNFAQITHQKKLVGGYIYSRALSEESLAFINGNPFLQKASCHNFSEGNDNQEIAGKQLKPILKEVLSQNNIRFILLHKEVLNLNECAGYKTFLEGYFQGEPIYFEDTELRVYKID